MPRARPEKAMAPHSNTLAWQITWTEEPGRLQSMGSRTVGHNWATSLSLITFLHWRRKWKATPVFLPGESQGRRSRGPLSMGSHRVGHDWSNLAAAAAGQYLHYLTGVLYKTSSSHSRYSVILSSFFLSYMIYYNQIHWDIQSTHLLIIYKAFCQML